MRWAFANFPEVESVVVAGCSAGSVGSAFHVPAVLQRWPGARVTQLGDSLAFVFPEPVSVEQWGAPAHFPSFFRIGPRPFTIVEYFNALTRRYPKRTFARFNHTGDNVQKMFLGAYGGDRSTFEPLLRVQETELKKLPNYRSYLACGGFHCAFPTPLFYSTRVDGVRLSDWVAKIADGRNVTCPDCGG